VQVVVPDAFDIAQPLFTGYDSSVPIELELLIGGDRSRTRLDLVQGIRAQNELAKAAFAPPATYSQSTNPPTILSVEESRSGNTLNWSVGIAPNGQYLTIGDPFQPMYDAVFLPLQVGQNIREASRQFGNIDTRYLSDEVVSVVRIIQPNLKSLSLAAPRDVSIIMADIGTDRKIPLWLMGGGVNRLLQFALYMVDTPGKILLVDEFDAGFHHLARRSVFRALLEAARRHGCQIIATTHSYEALSHLKDAAEGEFENDLAFVRLTKLDSEIKATTYDYEHFSVAIDMNMELR
jgi:hypothetical protein